MRRQIHILSSDHGIDMEGSKELGNRYLSNRAASLLALTTQVRLPFLCKLFQLIYYEVSKPCTVWTLCVLCLCGPQGQET